MRFSILNSSCFSPLCVLALIPPVSSHYPLYKYSSLLARIPRPISAVTNLAQHQATSQVMEIAVAHVPWRMRIVGLMDVFQQVYSNQPVVTHRL